MGFVQSSQHLCHLHSRNFILKHMAFGFYLASAYQDLGLGFIFTSIISSALKTIYMGGATFNYFTQSILFWLYP